MNNRPPRIVKFFLKLFISCEDKHRLNEFEDIFNYIDSTEGKYAAQKWYWKHTIKSIPGLIKTNILGETAMLKNYFTIAFRNIRKYKTYSAINILGLAAGIACSILILMWVFNEYDYDRFHSKGDRIYRVVQNVKFENVVQWGIVQGPLGPALKEATPEIEDYTRFRTTNWAIKYKDKSYNFWGAYTDPQVFEVFDFPLLRGDKKTVLQNPHSIIITESMAESIFGNEDPIGKTINISDQYDLTVTGILGKIPDNSHIKFSFLSTMEFAKERGNTVEQWNNSGFITYVLLREGANYDKASEKVYNFLADKPTLEKGSTLILQPLFDIHFTSDIGFDLAETMNYQYIIIFSSAAIFILLIACINFMNLSTARASLRAREVGLRKVVGAKKSQLIKQFMSESVIITLIALVIAVCLAALFMPVFNTIAEKNFTYAFFTKPKLILSLFAIFITTGFLSGSYPALVLSSFQPIKILRSSSSGDNRGVRLRKFLVVFQYIITATLLIGTFVVYEQINFMQNMPLGFDKENIIYFTANYDVMGSYDAFRNELMSNPSVLNVCRSTNIPIEGFSFSNAKWRWDGCDPENPTLFRATFIDKDFIDTYGMKIKEGRTFSDKFPSDSAAIVINETAAKIIGYNEPVGMEFYYENRDSLIPLNIIGVVEDYNYRSLHSQIEPLILIMTDNNTNLVSVKLAANKIPSTISFIKATYEKFGKISGPNFNFLDESLNTLYTSEKNIGNILQYFAVLAIFISCLGLIGLSSFMALRRTKEIGIRKVLGASTPIVSLLLLKEFLIYVVVANIIAGPIAYYLMNDWLQDFAYHTSIGFGIFLFTGIIALFFALITTSYQSIKAALANPIDSIKYE